LALMGKISCNNSILSKSVLALVISLVGRRDFLLPLFGELLC
jgi:hypothetical protein